MNYKVCLWFFLIGIVFGCSGKKEKASSVGNEDAVQKKEVLSSTVKYASKFKIEVEKDYTVVTVSNPWQGANQDYVYVLFTDSQEKPDLSAFRKSQNEIIQEVRIPLERVVLTSTTFIPLLEQLEEAAALVGFPGTDHIASENIRRLVDDGKVENLGAEAQLNIEKLINLNPDALMDYAMQGENKSGALARKGGIPVLYNADYLEATPLGRAEWIKFAGAFFDKSQKADSIFNALEQNYDSLKALASKTEYNPTVFSGIVYGDTWFLPGGRNSAAQFLKDAQADYLWKDTPNEGSIKLSFEAVYDKALDADFWIGAASFNSLQEIKNADNRYANFRAFKEGNVYTYNAKMGAKGGLTFFELGYARPDLVLADHIKILHPELLPDYELYFYKRLE